VTNGTGKPIAGQEVNHTLRLAPGEREFGRWNFGDGFGGTVETDAEGRFEVDGLVVGETYWFSLKLDDNRSRNLLSLEVEEPADYDVTVTP